MSINGRLSKIEWVLAVDEVDLPQSVPMEWVKRNGDGRLIGPPEDARPAQRRTYEELAEMLASVPALPLPQDVEPQ